MLAVKVRLGDGEGDSKADSQYPPCPSPLALPLADARSRAEQVLCQFSYQLGVGTRPSATCPLKRSQTPARLKREWYPTMPCERLSENIFKARWRLLVGTGVYYLLLSVRAYANMTMLLTMITNTALRDDVTTHICAAQR